MSSTLIRTVSPCRTTPPVRRYFTLSRRAIASGASILPRKRIVELRGDTFSSGTAESCAVNSSETPSLRYAWVLSPLRFSNGSTPMLGSSRPLVRLTSSTAAAHRSDRSRREHS